MIWLTELACLYLAVAVVLYLSLVLVERPSLDEALGWAVFCLAWPLLLLFAGKKGVRW